jgi:hypothetical protein
VVLVMILAAGGQGELPSLNQVLQSAADAPEQAVSCDDIGDVWQELCRQGGCEPRADGGCRKRSASGVCTTMAGCVQGRNLGGLGDWVPVLTPAVVPEDIELIRQVSPPLQRYVNLVAPEHGQELLCGEPLRVRFHVEIFVSPEHLGQVAAQGGDGLSIKAGTVIHLTPGGEREGGREREREEGRWGDWAVGQDPRLRLPCPGLGSRVYCRV